MVVESTLDLAYLGLFLGLRVNDTVRERGAERGFRGMRDSHGYVVQHLIEADRTITELAARMEVSQQAASKSVAELVRRGILESVAADDRRTRTIRLSKRGWEAVHFARNTRRRIERRLQRQVGLKQYQEARSVLLICLKSLGGIGRVRARRIRAPG
jgi:DNA-binding MarR family transcriptional regulator